MPHSNPVADLTRTIGTDTLTLAMGTTDRRGLFTYSHKMVGKPGRGEGAVFHIDRSDVEAIRDWCARALAGE